MLPVMARCAKDRDVVGVAWPCQTLPQLASKSNSHGRASIAPACRFQTTGTRIDTTCILSTEDLVKHWVESRDHFLSRLITVIYLASLMQLLWSTSVHESRVFLTDTNTSVSRSTTSHPNDHRLNSWSCHATKIYKAHLSR